MTNEELMDAIRMVHDLLGKTGVGYKYHDDLLKAHADLLESLRERGKHMILPFTDREEKAFADFRRKNA